MPVYMANGRRLGFTSEIGHAVDYLHVQQGRVILRDWYIPISAVRSVTADGIQLWVDVPEMRSRHWNVPSEEYLLHQGATPGYEYTSRADIPQYGELAHSATRADQ